MSNHAKEEYEIIRHNPAEENNTEATTIVLTNETSTEVSNIAGNIETSFVNNMENAWITDDFQASQLKQIISLATKTISTKDEWVITVPDYTNRLNALKLSLQAKWHLSPKERKSDLFEWKIFVFTK